MSARRRKAAARRTSLIWVTALVLLGALSAGAWALSRGPAVVAPPDAALQVPAAQAAPPSAQSVDDAARAAARAQRPPGTAALRAQSAGCESCHGELELLRQQAGGLARARELLVPAHLVAGSAHADMSCAECHTNYARYPHDDQRTQTTACAGCHQQADTLWSRGVHANADETVGCVECHTAHDVRTVDVIRSPEGAHLGNAPCLSCHEANALPRHEPHAQEIACAACHAPHDNRPVDDPESSLAPANQLRTCGACHEDVADVWQRDIHGDTALRERHLGGREPAAATVMCTSCHTGHEMLALEDTAFSTTSVQRCAQCHEKATRTFFGSYHGKATSLGSTVSAACHDCHSAHEILPDSMSASHVSEARLVETCGQCHEHARPAFVKYDSHPDPFNRARNPWLFYAFFGMNGLLAFVLIVFGGHTVLWWIRLWLDKRRGIVHGPGQHGHGGHT
jgi:hypothetical protein